MNAVMLKDRWKYTKLGALSQQSWKARPDYIESDSLLFVDDGDEAPVRLVFVDGHFDELASQVDLLPSELKWSVADAAMKSTISMGLTDVVVAETSTQCVATLALDDHAYCDRLIYIVSIITEQAAQCYIPIALHINLGEAAHCRVHVDTVSFNDSPSFSHLSTRVELAPCANLQHYMIQKNSQSLMQWQQHEVVQHKSSVYKAFHCHTGAALARLDVAHRFCGEHAYGEHLGFYHSNNQQQHHIYLDVVHEQAFCQSKQHFKGIIDDKAHAVFNTKVTVQKSGHGAQASQSNQNLLLSSQAEIDTKPDLEIYNDDVACSHGASVGNLDPNALFYLQSRGIDQEQARAMLTRSFAAELVHQIDDPMVRQGVEQSLHEVLDGVA